MNTISTFLEHFDLTQLISLLIQAIAALLCISFHERATASPPGAWGTRRQSARAECP